MALLVLRSFAVYGATAALALWLAHRFVIPIRPRIALVLALAPLLFTGKAMLTGGVYGGIDILYQAAPFGVHRDEMGVGPVRTPTLGDVVYQHVPWRAATRRALGEGRFPLWNPAVLAGEPLLAVQQAGVLQPGTWIGMLLPLPQAWTFDMSLRLLTALICAYLFLRDLGLCETASLLGAAGWAFSDFVIFFLGFSIGPPSVPLPLALLGARRVARQPGRRSVLILAVAFVATLAGGHPETSLHVGSAAGLYFLFELMSAPRGRRLRSIALALSGVALALGLCAVILLPVLEILPQTAEHAERKGWYAHTKRSLPWAENVARLAPQIVPYSVGVAGRGNVLEGLIEPSAYAGALLFPLVVTGLFSRSRTRWFFLGLGLFCLCVCIKTPAADLLTKLPFFDIALNERLIFLVAFSVCVLAALGVERLHDGEGLRALLVGTGLTIATVAWLFVRLRPQMASLEMPGVYMRQRLVMQLAPVVVGIGMLAALSRARRTRAGLVALLVVFAAQRVIEAGRVNPTVPAQSFYPRLAVLDPMRRAEPWRMTATSFSFIPNASAVYGLEDVRGYEALNLRILRETYPLWSERQGIWFNRVDNPEKPFLAFLNVRWVLTSPDAPPPAGWSVAAEADGLRLIENPRVLPRAFVPKLLRTEPDPARRIDVLKSIADFGERGVLADGAASDWESNGEARVSVAAYGAQSMELDVQAKGDALIATSIPAWRGWRAEVDGRQRDLVLYNHAFLGLRVPQGNHRLSLRYAPEGFRRGLVVSLVTLTLLVGWLTLSRTAQTG